MSDFDYRDYPSAQLFDESYGFWIIPGLVKWLSPSEAAILLRPSEKGRSTVVFPSSQVCLVRFDCDMAWPEDESIDQRLRSITKLWVFVAVGQVATPLRVVPRPLSFVFRPKSGFDLTIPLEPPLSYDELNIIGVKYHSIATINDSENRYIKSEQDAEELCRYLRKLPSFWLHANRFEGSELHIGVDVNGAVVDYVDIKRGIKLISLNLACMSKDVVRQKIDPLPYMELETERRHLIPVEKGLDILRTFLVTGEPADLVPWPDDN
jgi:hypothetical protein